MVWGRQGVYDVPRVEQFGYWSRSGFKGCIGVLDSSVMSRAEYLFDFATRVHFRKIHFSKIHFRKIHFCKIHFQKIHFRKIHFWKIHKNNWGPLSSTFHIGRPETLADWKSKSVTNQPTDRLTWVGARDTCVSKN